MLFSEVMTKEELAKELARIQKEHETTSKEATKILHGLEAQEAPAV